jgi:pimeloyl-ACP methyl ester carboxylesterase
MHFTSSTRVDLITARTFTVGDIPGILWEPDGIANPPLLLLQHGGGQHKAAPGVVDRALRFAASGFASVAIDAPAHGDRPRDPFDEPRLAEMQRRMAAGKATN